MKKTHVIGLAVPLIALAAFFLAPSFMIAGGPIRHFPSRMRQSVSPDGKREITITKRVAFPASEFIDPRVVVRITLRRLDLTSDEYSGSFTLDEDSDFRVPGVTWGKNDVTLTEVDNRRGGSLRIAFAE